MQFLPIVERELRVASRHGRTWWRRVLTTTLAVFLFILILLTVGDWRGPQFVGRELFAALSWVGVIYALLSGPLTTTDCVSRERREGTLGLLFLTDLRSYDVVLGKMAAASLDVVLDLLAALPIAAIPILLGGVTLPQLGFVALTLFNTMFLSLALATCASALSRSGRSALAVTIGILFLLTLGLIILGEGVLDIRFGSPASWWFYMLCPIYGLESCFRGSFRIPQWNYWLNLGATHFFAWLCLLAATCRTAKSWRDLPVSARLSRLQDRFQRWRTGSGPAQLKRRASMLRRNPIAWLEGRDRLPERILWGSLLIAAIISSVLHIRYPHKFPDEAWLIILPTLAHYGLCVLIAIEAPRRLADDRESGALELLLCTPIRPAQIVRGCMMILWRRFGLTFLALLVLELYLACLYYHQRGGWSRSRDPELNALFITGLVTFPLQLYALARVGFYQGLRQPNSLRATFMVIGALGLLPWMIWILTMITLETIGRRMLGVRSIDNNSAYALWAFFHLLVCAILLAHATWRLRRDFRSLAARALDPPWWKRWLRLRR